MMRRIFCGIFAGLFCFCAVSCGSLGQRRAGDAETDDAIAYDVVVVGGTPGGIMAAIAAARGGCRVVLLERSRHIGGLPANGLGATDIHTRGATGGLFKEFVDRIYKYYVDQYGANSPQVVASSSGYRFEPSVAEKIFHAMLAGHKGAITVLTERQFDALPGNVTRRDGALRQVCLLNRTTGTVEVYQGRVFIDATYEGDLAAAAGAPFRLGRESFDEYREPMAGRLYKQWRIKEPGPGSTGEGDDAVQAYNYRLCLTMNESNQMPISRPDDYNGDEYVSLIDDILQNRLTGPYRGEMAFGGIGRIVNMVMLPNDKTDANNQHLAFISTDLPEENWPWPTADWAWRDRYAKRLRDYTLGLIWFAQNDHRLPEEYRAQSSLWGLAADEYEDNGHFPRQVYIREGRRIEGAHLFTAHDAIPVKGRARPPVYADSITASHYFLDSHAVRKREPGRVHLDGFFSYPTKPYTVPFGVMVPNKVEGLLTPVPVSGTHIGFSTLRMEPCWMAMGQAAGVAAALSVQLKRPPRQVPMTAIQETLLRQGAILIYFKDAKPGDPHFEALQFCALWDVLEAPGWEARLNDSVDEETIRKWTSRIDAKPKGALLRSVRPGKTTRGELLDKIHAIMKSKR